MTYYIDDLKPGMSESFTKTISERDIQLFGEVSGDTNPVHFDEAFASSTPFKGRIAHGVLTASYISTVLGMDMPGPGTIVGDDESDRLTPVFRVNGFDSQPGRGRFGCVLLKEEVLVDPVGISLQRERATRHVGYQKVGYRVDVAAGGPDLWHDFMAELRTLHLGAPAPDRDGPSVRERLSEAYAAAL